MMIGNEIEIKTEFGTKKFISLELHEKLVSKFMDAHRLDNVQTCLELYVDEAKLNKRYSNDNPHFKMCQANISIIKELIEGIKR